VTLPPPAEWPIDEPVPAVSPDVLRSRAAATPDATALVDADGDRTLTYEQFDRRVEEWSDGLSAAVSSETSRIGVALPTGVGFATAYFAVVRRNWTALPLNLREATGTVERQANAADLDAVVCSDETAEMARAVAPSGATVVSVDDTETEGVRGLDPTAVGDASGGDTRTASGDTERLVLFTSGTTGDPKGVRLTRENLLASAVGSARRLGVEAHDRWLVCLPMYHMGGLAPLVRSTLYGTTTVLQPEFDVAATAGVLAEHDVTGVSLVPTQLTRLLDAGWEPPASLRFVLLGGAPARPALIERCRDAGVPVFPTYGTTETASQITTATPTEAFDAPSTVGRPLRGTTVTVLDDGNECEPGATGELVVDGPTVTPGYLDERQTDAAFDERGFHTGDVGYRDEDGRYYVVGRVDDRIVTGGENVHPPTVVRALEAQSSVETAAVVGIPDEEWGERVAAAVVPATSTCTVEGVRERVAENLAAFAVPKTIELVETIPRTASGTVDRERVRELLSDGDSDR